MQLGDIIEDVLVYMCVLTCRLIVQLAFMATKYGTYVLLVNTEN